jgi:hypothetical protein
MASTGNSKWCGSPASRHPSCNKPVGTVMAYVFEYSPIQKCSGTGRGISPSEKPIVHLKKWSLTDKPN